MIDLYFTTKEIINKGVNDSNYELSVSVVNKHCELYYTYDSPIISDYEYDMLYKKVTDYEKKNGLSQILNKVGH